MELLANQREIRDTRTRANVHQVSLDQNAEFPRIHADKTNALMDPLAYPSSINITLANVHPE